MCSIQDQTPQVTVVIPVYNVQKYIERCARSIFEQTLENMEIIFIDDCSPDYSTNIIRKVLDEYPARKGATRLLRMPSNAGQAGVRRRGILEARGKYVIHCDGDDWVDPDLYERLLAKAGETGADIVVCDFIYETKSGPVVSRQPDLAPSAQSNLKNWYRRFFHLSVCNKLVRREICIANDILPWTGLNMWEDNGLMFRIFAVADVVAQVHGPCYHYNKTNESSISAAYGRRQVGQMIDIASNVSDFFSSRNLDGEFKCSLDALRLYAKINLITDSFSGLAEYKQTFPGSEYIISRLDPYAFSSKGRIRWRMVRFKAAWLFVCLFKIHTLMASRHS